MSNELPNFKNECSIQIPSENDSNLNNTIDDKTPKGKLKALFRKMESKLTQGFSRHITGINAQLDNMHGSLYSQLDKKYGGMYKTLISVFLTNIESKIHNCEINIEAMKSILETNTYDLYCKNQDLKGESSISKKEFILEYHSKFQEMKKEIHEKVVEAREKGEVESNEQDSNPESKEQDNKEPERSKESEEEIQDNTNGQNDVGEENN